MTNIQQGLKPGALLHNNTYRIERVLGQGGFGITYLAVHVRLKKRVAIKEFFPKAFCDRDADTSHVKTASKANSVTVEKLKNKFIKEAEHIAEMDSPYIVRIIDVFEENHTAYYIMDYIEGRSLSDMVKNDGPLSVGQAVEYITKIGEALTYIHSKRMNHLDVKPANIMVRSNDNTPILIDFGLSKQYDSDGNQTSTTPVGISHGYAPMEQYNEGGVKEFSPQTDLYSLAATFYYLLSGVVPPHAPMLLDDELTFPASISINLIPTIVKAMSPSRRKRHETICQFVNEIRKYNSGIAYGNDEDTYFGNCEPKLQQRYSDYSNMINGHQYVDLGLPSGLKWATSNIGAENPSEYGEYFAWGETPANSKYSAVNNHTYGKSISQLQSESIIDSKGVLDGSYDAAHIEWGGSWRMPTEYEIVELVKHCKWTWTKQDGKNGYKIIGKNGKSIFMPAAGHRNGQTLLNVGESGSYWSSSALDISDFANVLLFNSNYHNSGWNRRNQGRTIRAVSE